MNSPSKLYKLFVRIRGDFQKITFEQGPEFRWDSDKKTVYYREFASQEDVWLLLHELGHMHARHDTYASDFALLTMERAAWDEALILAKKYDMSIDDSYIEDCLDSYRDWIHKRSTCPVCGQTGIEKPRGNYRCINCKNQWQVSDSRFCRVYRKQKTPR